MDVSGTYAYLADYGGGLQIINIFDPLSPVSKGNWIAPTGSNAYGVAVSGSYAYVADRLPEMLRIINIADPLNPTLIGSCDIAGYALGVSVVGKYTYVAANAEGFKVIDLLP